MAGTKHEVEGEVTGSFEVVIDSAEDKDVGRVKPELPFGWWRSGVESFRDCLRESEVDRWDKTKFESPGEGGADSGDAVGAHIGRIRCKGLLNMLLEALGNKGDITGKGTKCT